MAGGTRRRSTLLAASMMCGLAAVLYVVPPSIERPVRAAVVDLVISGQAATLERYDRLRPSLVSWNWRRLIAFVGNASEAAGMPAQASPAATASQERIDSLELQCRRLRVENARLRDELSTAEKYGVSPIPVSTGHAAEPPAVIRAAVLGRDALELWRTAPHLNQGHRHGVSESSLVLDAAAPHLDQGSDSGVQPELDVLIGRCVVGRIANVGRWTSTLEPITDSRYRALAQIIRPSEQGGSFGTEGILVGQGTSFCKLTEVPTTQSVRVGDEVYTSERDHRTPVPLYYGRVVRVEESGRNWDIAVEPAVKVADLRTVAVLKIPPILGRTLAE
jgi:rod shape-determining protein MreC